jgi:hypothetical protein
MNLEGEFAKLNRKAEERWGELNSFRNGAIYNTDRGWQEDGEPTKPWLVWSADENDETTTYPDAQDEVDFVRSLSDTFFQPWEPFLKVLDHETFHAQRYFIGSRGWKNPDYQDAVRDLCNCLGLKDQNPKLLGALTDLKTIRDESRKLLGDLGTKLKKKVFDPLRRVMIPCCVEAERALTGFAPVTEENVEERRKALHTAQLVDHYYQNIGRGLSFQRLQETHDRAFKHVPEPVSEGVKDALRCYVEKGDGGLGDDSRDALLDRYRPIYLRWRTSRDMIHGALWGWPIERIGLESSKLQGPEHELIEAFAQSGIDQCDDWTLKKHLQEWAVKEVGTSPTETVRILKSLGVWVKGRQGVDGSGLQGTIPGMKDLIDDD